MYSIGEVSKITGLTNHTIRFYEKEGLLYSIDRDNNGLRKFTDDNVELLKTICCLKETGMSISNIKVYVDLCKQNENTTLQRKEIFILQKQHLIDEKNKIDKLLDMVNYKIWYYENIDNIEKEILNPTCKQIRNIYDNLNK